MPRRRHDDPSSTGVVGWLTNSRQLEILLCVEPWRRTVHATGSSKARTLREWLWWCAVLCVLGSRSSSAACGVVARSPTLRSTASLGPWSCPKTPRRLSSADRSTLMRRLRHSPSTVPRRRTSPRLRRRRDRSAAGVFDYLRRLPPFCRCPDDRQYFLNRCCRP